MYECAIFEFKLYPTLLPPLEGEVWLPYAIDDASRPEMVRVFIYDKMIIYKIKQNKIIITTIFAFLIKVYLIRPV